MTPLSTISIDSSELVDFAQTYDGETLLIKTKSAAYDVDTSALTATRITNQNYPTATVRGVAYLDGTFYVMDTTGTIYGSEVNDPTTWTALNVIAASSEPDAATALVKVNQYVVAFGRYTTQFFYNAGNAIGSPLSPVSNGTALYGCANGNSVGYIEGTLFFVSQAKAQGQAFAAGLQVGTLNGMNYSSISTDSIERVLNADGCTTCYGSNIMVLGHKFYLLTLPDSSVTLAFDVETRLWSRWTTLTAGTAVTLTSLTSAANVDGTTATATATVSGGHGFADGDVITIAGAGQAAYNVTVNITVTSTTVFTYQVASIPVTPATGTITATGYTSSYFPLICGCNFGTTQIMQHLGNGGMYEITESTYTDISAPIDAHIRTARLDGDTNQQKFLSWMDLITDRSAYYALVRYTDDDYQTYSKYRRVLLSGDRSRLNRQGYFKRRAFEIRVTDNAAFRMQGLDLGVEKGNE